MTHRSNLEMLSQIAVRLGPMRERVVFLGGATVGLFITDPAAPSIRVTNDVDVVIEVGSTLAYLGQLRDELRALGFSEDSTPDAPICRWVADGILLDVMPTNAEILGFSNRWYPLAMSTATRHQLSKNLSIRLVTPPCFVATKLEAFRGRGRGDYAASHDLEDLIAVVDGREVLSAEVATTDRELRQYVAATIADLLNVSAFLDALPGHVPPDAGSQDRVSLILNRLRRLADVSAAGGA